jgi:TetR/AcrR family transcriptional regulator, transcriptional repressor for nem operon
MPRTKPPQQRRSDLLDAAQSLVVEKGVAATTLDDVTRRAGVAKGTFYLYFRSKDDLVAALQQRFGDRMAGRIEAAARDAETWAGKLDACVLACFADYRETYELHDVLFHHAGTAERMAGMADRMADRHVPDDAAPSSNRVIGALRDLLAAGVEAGAYRVDDPDMTAVLLFSAAHGAYEACCHGPGRPDEAELVAATQQLFRRSVGLT